MEKRKKIKGKEKKEEEERGGEKRREWKKDNQPQMELCNHWLTS